MITAHKKNHRIPLSSGSKQQISMQALRREASITQIASLHGCSRSTVYAQMDKAISAVNHTFDADDTDVLYYIPVTKTWLHQVVLALFLICQSSYRNILFFMGTLFNYSLSIGSVFNIIHHAANNAEQINQSYDLSAIKTSAADELFHRNKPHLAVVDIDSRFCALLKKAEQRDSDTWGIHLLDLQRQGYSPDTTIMDSAKGLNKGHEIALPKTVRRQDHFHLLQDVKDCGRYLTNEEASSATATLKLLHKTDKIRHKNEKKQHRRKYLLALKRHQQLENICRQFNLLSQWLQFDVLQLPGHEPETRTMLYDFIVEEMALLATRHPHRIGDIVTSLKTQRDGVLEVSNTLNHQFTALASHYHQPIDVIWRLCYIARYSLDSTKYHEEAEHLVTIIGEKYDALENDVLAILESTHRCSSMIENFNSRLRPYLDEQKFMTQKTLSLIQFYLNHKPFMRSQHQRLIHKTPAQAMTGKDHPHWLEMLGFQLFNRKAA